jgi:hypothetical protein
MAVRSGYKAAWSLIALEIVGRLASTSCGGKTRFIRRTSQPVIHGHEFEISVADLRRNHFVRDGTSGKL